MRENRFFYIMAAIVLSIIVCAMIAKSQSQTRPGEEKSKADTTISVSVEKITAQIENKIPVNGKPTVCMSTAVLLSRNLGEK